MGTIFNMGVCNICGGIFLFIMAVAIGIGFPVAARHENDACQVGDILGFTMSEWLTLLCSVELCAVGLTVLTGGLYHLLDNNKTMMVASIAISAWNAWFCLMMFIMTIVVLSTNDSNECVSNTMGDLVITWVFVLFLTLIASLYYATDRYATHGSSSQGLFFKGGLVVHGARVAFSVYAVFHSGDCRHKYFPFVYGALDATVLLGTLIMHFYIHGRPQHQSFNSWQLFMGFAVLFHLCTAIAMWALIGNFIYSSCDDEEYGYSLLFNTIAVVPVWYAFFYGMFTYEK